MTDKTVKETDSLPTTAGIATSGLQVGHGSNAGQFKPGNPGGLRVFALIAVFFWAWPSLAAAQPVSPRPNQQQNFTPGELVSAGQQFFGTVSRRATCSPATAGAAKAGIDQASPGRRHDISINSISATLHQQDQALS